MKWVVIICMIFAMFINIDTKLAASPTIFLHHFLLVPLFFVFVWKYRLISKPLLGFIFLFILIGILEIGLGNNTFGLFIKTYSGLVISIIFFFYVIKYFNYNVEDLFKIYVWGCILTCYVFFIQIISYRIGFKPGYDLGYIGINSIIDAKEGYLPAGFAAEPSGLSILGPATLIAIHNIILRKNYLISIFHSILILIVAVLSASSTVYLGLLFSVIIIAISFRAFSIFIVSVGISIVSFILLYSYSTKFKTRFDDSVNVFVHQTVNEDNMKSFNGSTMVLYHHLIITQRNFKDHPILGTGIGSHSLAHDRYSPFDEKFEWYFLNKADANSLFLRLASETGLLGLFLFFYFMVKCSVGKTNAKRVEHWLINKSLLVIMFTALLRGGSYMAGAFPFFILLYYYSYRAEKEEEITPYPASLSLS